MLGWEKASLLGKQCLKDIKGTATFIDRSQQRHIRHVELVHPSALAISHPPRLLQNYSNHMFRPHSYSSHRLSPVNTPFDTLLKNFLRFLSNDSRGKCVLTFFIKRINDEFAVTRRQIFSEGVGQLAIPHQGGWAAAPQNRLIVLELGNGEDGLDEIIAVGAIRDVGCRGRRILAYGFAEGWR